MTPPEAGSARLIVRDFFATLREPDTYLPWRNLYALFGLLWALPIPLLATYLHTCTDGWCGASGDLLDGCWLLALAFAHIPFFLVVFGAFGTLRRKQDQRIQELMAVKEDRLQEIHESHRQLRELDRLKDEFVANVTHELKTPMVSACAYAEMMLQGRMGEINDRQKHGLEVAVRNLRRLQALIDDMLLFAQMEAGSFHPYPAPFPIDELVHEMGALFMAPCAAKGVSLHLPAEPLETAILAELEGIRRVLVNLLSNALKFSRPGGDIYLRLRATEAGVLVEVEDCGLGIPRGALPRIFDRFHQVEGTRGRRFGGSGLGLAIVKRVLDAHGIEIDVESEEGRGTTFRFTLSRAPGGGAREPR